MCDCILSASACHITLLRAPTGSVYKYKAVASMRNAAIKHIFCLRVTVTITHGRNESASRETILLFFRKKVYHAEAHKTRGRGRRRALEQGGLEELACELLLGQSRQSIVVQHAPDQPLHSSVQQHARARSIFFRRAAAKKCICCLGTGEANVGHEDVIPASLMYYGAPSRVVDKTAPTTGSTLYGLYLLAPPY